MSMILISMLADQIALQTNIGIRIIKNVSVLRENHISTENIALIVMEVNIMTSNRILVFIDDSFIGNFFNLFK